MQGGRTACVTKIRGTEAPPCNQGHTCFKDLGTDDDSGWACNGKDEDDGCVNQCTGVGQSEGWRRFSCATCDFTYCDKCYERAKDRHCVRITSTL